MRNPRQIVALVYDGAFWAVIGAGGQAVDAVEVSEDDGEDSACVTAARIVDYVDLLVNRVGGAMAGGLSNVALSLTENIHLAEPSANQSAINALASAFVSQYADDTELYAAFTTTVYDSLRCAIYCAGDGTTTFTPDMLAVITSVMDAESDVPYDLISSVLTVTGADGLTRAVGLSDRTATTAECSGGCACTISVEFQTASSSTHEGTTHTVTVILHIDGAGTLPSDLTVDVDAVGGTATDGDDYTLDDTSVTFAAGSADGATQTIELTITQDLVYESTDETIILQLDNPTLGDLDAQSTHTVTISLSTCADNDLTVMDGDFEVYDSDWGEGGEWIDGIGWRATYTVLGGDDGYRVGIRKTCSITAASHVHVTMTMEVNSVVGIKVTRISDGYVILHQTEANSGVDSHAVFYYALGAGGPWTCEVYVELYSSSDGGKVIYEGLDIYT